MEELKFEKVEKNSCPVRQTLDMIGGKWPFAIIYALVQGTKRFKELERSIDGINTRMLVKELKALEASGIVNRKAYATVPPTVEYSLTEKGKELQPVLSEIQKWALKYI
ncbi:MAG TPA: helix-turn-helix domain-containing protein [Saprospiraceae bacterium]|nr:helix-turn-helix domain-containing protein [Saprospiraceae bacterium]HMQ82336.1 helix-turn-helix domain-containing protein [Saprospiraceae bacterium]